MSADLEPKHSSVELSQNDALTDIFYGSIAGCLGKIIEYPFDTVKVRLQTQSSTLFPNTWSCIKYTYKNEGIRRGFFQGISSPLVGAAMENAVLFLSYNQCSKFLESRSNLQLSSLQNIIVSGAFAGSCASFVLTPVELIKCRLQVLNIHNATNVTIKYSNKILPTIFDVLKSNGVFGLWKGQSSTFIRESVGGVAWFSTYELLKSSLLKRRQKKNPEIKDNCTWELLISGGSSGLAFNATIFPADTVKSVMQTEHKSLTEAFKSIMLKQGIKGFYRGLGITLIRAVPANATVFYVYETLSKI
ncbi:hypothetical protein TPHA_0E01570 [Tetrapisispora phaffii CBS 4417]|uniref:Mitochondrial ornithine carrier protein n=1 Tax=Tetrapisispora phaffii (strain ATCC 24235 / CBS 4417 / NBRC 1672 / NRRL Y-8282 / UCD 70-5) TaxID=1071381 RepID=G8BTM2_TETPH|nr:hypothetical protein TPHA_0E01570 [Tetrapisispora phaffii CBS 4417]CCE63250.1 hypothetical protein TPHA_0E01570 [Tetrapisispora phaffii CBS 4417]